MNARFDDPASLPDPALIAAAEAAASLIAFRHPLKRHRKVLLLRELARRFSAAIDMERGGGGSRRRRRPGSKGRGRQRMLCLKCGNDALRPADHLSVKGMPGVRYEQCGACGHVVTIRMAEPPKSPKKPKVPKITRTMPPRDGRIKRKTESES